MKHTTVAGLDEGTLNRMERRQQLHEEQTKLIEKGFVPVAPDFAAIARQCGCEVETDAEITHWIPAWFEAAWRAFRNAGKNADAFGTPTLEFQQYVTGLVPQERFMLVAEMLLEVPFRQEQKRAGTEAWLKIHG